MNNPPTVFSHNSLDWRFLLPITVESKILIIGHEYEYIQKYFFNLGVSEVYCCADNQPKVADLDKNNTQQKMLTYDDLIARSSLFSFFDVVVFPSGLPNTKIEILELFEFVKKFVRPSGILFVSFANELLSKEKHSYSSHPIRIKNILKKNGYNLVGVYGAIPDQYIPEYVFPLTPQAIGFIVRHRYAYKVPNIFLRLLSSPFVAKMLSNFFPAYFMMATINA